MSLALLLIPGPVARVVVARLNASIASRAPAFVTAMEQRAALDAPDFRATLAPSTVFARLYLPEG